MIVGQFNNGVLICNDFPLANFVLKGQFGTYELKRDSNRFSRVFIPDERTENLKIQHEETRKTHAILNVPHPLMKSKITMGEYKNLHDDIRSLYTHSDETETVYTYENLDCDVHVINKTYTPYEFKQLELFELSFEQVKEDIARTLLMAEFVPQTISLKKFMMKCYELGPNVSRSAHPLRYNKVTRLTIKESGTMTIIDIEKSIEYLKDLPMREQDACLNRMLEMLREKCK